MAIAWEFRGYDKDQVHMFLSGYCDIDNTFSPKGGEEGVKVVMRGSHSDAFFQGVVSFNAPFRFNSEKRDFFTILACRSGNVVVDTERGATALKAGDGVCISPTDVFDTICPDSVSGVITRLDAARVTRICSLWMGAALDGPPKLDLSPFSARFRAHWDLVVDSIEMLHANDAFGEWSSRSLEEYAVSLLLHSHTHNYVGYLRKGRAASARIVAEAEAFIREKAGEPLTPGAVAEFFGCSLAALRKGFEQHLGISVRECIYASRVARLRNLILTGDAESYHHVLRGSGFINVRRLEAVYRGLYGESPAQTLHRHTTASGRGKRSDSLSTEKMERLHAHIHSSLSRPLKISELASLVGMSTTRFRLAFRKAFGVSPAQYVLRERLNWAHWLLTNTGKGVAAIAAETGFSSQAHLTTALRHCHGVTPGALRAHGHMHK